MDETTARDDTDLAWAPSSLASSAAASSKPDADTMTIQLTAADPAGPCKVMYAPHEAIARESTFCSVLAGGYVVDVALPEAPYDPALMRLALDFLRGGSDADIEFPALSQHPVDHMHATCAADQLLAPDWPDDGTVRDALAGVEWTDCEFPHNLVVDRRTSGTRMTSASPTTGCVFKAAPTTTWWRYRSTR